MEDAPPTGSASSPSEHAEGAEAPPGTEPRAHPLQRIDRPIAAMGRTLAGRRAARAEGDRGHWHASLAALFIAVTVFGFQQTAITPALPVVENDLGASREWTTWLLSGYFIVASITPVFLGKVADRSGKRRVLVAALAVFLAGSVGTALAPTIGLVVVCRLIQGVGGVVFPLAFAMIRDELPAKQVSHGIGILAGGFGLGSVGGYVVGGLITQFLGWRWIFWIGAIGLAFAIVAVRVTLPESPARARRSLDIPGAVLFGVALSAIILVFTEGPERGWTAPLTLGMFALAVGASAGWVVRELHTDEPLMDLRVLSSRVMLLANAASLLSGYAAVGAGVLVTFLLQDRTGSHLTAFGLTAGPLLTGLVLLPRALGQSVGGPTAEPLSVRFGQVRTLVTGMTLMMAGLVGLALWRDTLWTIVIELAVVGVGFGLAVAVLGSIVTLAADVAETGVATSINSVMRRVGGAIGAQVGVALLATFTVGAHGEPAPAAYTAAFVAAATAAFVGALCALFITPLGRGRT